MTIADTYAKDYRKVRSYQKYSAEMTRMSEIEDTWRQPVSGCEPSCPVARASEILSGKWTTLIVRDLLSGKKRFSELERSLTGISPRMLSARLQMLEQARLISKTIFATVPPTTEYELTAEGRRIEPVIVAMAMFGAGLPATRDR